MLNSQRNIIQSNTTLLRQGMNELRVPYTQKAEYYAEILWSLGTKLRYAADDLMRLENQEVLFQDGFTEGNTTETRSV